MIDYIGDVSREDACVLQGFARKAQRILEFGCGASTQIFRAYGPGEVDSVETDHAWIGKTRRNLVALEIRGEVAFHEYARFNPIGQYDLIFVDGIDELRRPFALLAWASLAIGGRMLFHDTRRTKPHGPSPSTDVQNVLAVVERYSPEVEEVTLNIFDSNTTVIRKRMPLLYVDWMKAEGRSAAQMGIA